MKSLLMAVVLLASPSIAAYSQSSPRTSSEPPVHPGTAILDRMGIYAGNPVAEQNTQHAKTENVLVTQSSDTRKQ
jgi:hypothetical protein